MAKGRPLKPLEVSRDTRLKSFLQLVLQRIFDLVGAGPTLQKYRPALQTLLALGQIEPLPP